MKNFTMRTLTFLMAISAANVYADVKPANLFTDNMVIQQQANAAIWGWAEPGEKLTVSATWGENASTVADDSGYWLVKLNTPKASINRTYTITFKGNNQVDVENVLVGEVWLASGQSNMQWPVKGSSLPKAQRAQLDSSLIREYSVERTYKTEPASEVTGAWHLASGPKKEEFSATGFYFAHHLQQSLNVPIGIIHSSWGGTPIEAWLAKEVQAGHQPTQTQIAKVDNWLANFDEQAAEHKHQAMLSKWQKAKQQAIQQNKVFAWKRPKRLTKASRLSKYPSNLYNGMINPLKPYTLKGTIWYQGEGNAHAVKQAQFYQTQLTSLITSWRSDFNNPEMPFYVVQLANFRAPQENPVEAQQYWPITRDSMRKATDNLSNAAMAVAIDIGEAKNIHPKNKMEVGRRLALQALNNDYGHDIVAAGPLFKSFEIADNAIFIDFNHKGSGLMVNNTTQGNKSEKLQGFAIAGEDGKYVWAEAEIITQSAGWKFWQTKQLVKVHSEQVKAPKSVKYGWADNPTSINLYNEEGLPASPFSTD